MHIVHLSTARDYYGGEVCLFNLARGLAKRGHRVSCVVRPDSVLGDRLDGEPVELLHLPLVDWYEPVNVLRLGHWLRARPVDILHTHLPRDWFIASAATVGTSVRNVGTRHHLHPVQHATLKRPFLGRFAAMIAVSEAVRCGVLASGLMDTDRVVTVPNGIRIDRGDAPRAAPAGVLRRAAGAPHDAPVIGAVGRLAPEKGLETLLQAAAGLRERWPRLRVFVLGDGAGDESYPARLHALCRRLDLQDAVTWFGYVANAADVCADFDVQVVCSQAEPFGLVTLEAMAAAKPLVVTNTGGSPEIVRDGIEGFLVPPGDPDTLARRLDCLFDSPGLRVAMGLRGRERVRRHFGLDLMLDRTEAVYRSVLEPAAA